MPESRTNVSDAVKGGPAASQAVDSAVLEAQPVIPIYNNDGNLIQWVAEDKAREILKAGQGQLVRDKHGILRRIYLKSTPDAYTGPNAERLGPNSINSQASRTVRRESVGDIYSVFAPIMSDLRLKKRISNEELAKDGVFGKGGVDGAQ